MIEKLDREVDESQHATNIEQAERDVALAAIRSQMAAKAPLGFDKVNCMDCGLTIPKGRLALGKWTCVHCQELIDKADKMKGK